MMLAGAEAIAARAQPPGKGGSIFSLKNCQIQFVWGGYLPACILGALVICHLKCRLWTQIERKFKKNFNKGNASQGHDFKTNHKKIYCWGLINVIPLKEGVY